MNEVDNVVGEDDTIVAFENASVGGDVEHR